jgi:hypothetical protein
MIWIDAICIDQANIAERNAQVAIMGSIYSQASHVIIDIGEASEDSDFALDSIMDLQTKRRAEPVDVSLEAVAICEAIKILWRGPWFHRIWVLQEVFRAREVSVLCGSRYTSWIIHLNFACNLAFAAGTWAKVLCLFMPPVMGFGFESSTQQSAQQMFTTKGHLLELLKYGRSCNATLARDKLYELFLILEDASEQGLHADVAKDNTRVYSEVAVWLVENTGTGLLNEIGRKSNLAGLASWIPDWTLQNWRSWLGYQSECVWPYTIKCMDPMAKVLRLPGHRYELKIRGTVVRHLTDEHDLKSLILYSGHDAYLGDLVGGFVGHEDLFHLRKVELEDDEGGSAHEHQHEHYKLLGQCSIADSSGQAIDAILRDMDVERAHDEIPILPFVNFQIC